MASPTRMLPQMVICSTCLARSLQIKLKVCDYIKHIRVFHAFEPNFKFTCGINGCVRSYTNIGSFKNHVSDVHCNTDISDTANDLDRGSDASLPDGLLSSSNTSDTLDSTLEYVTDSRRDSDDDSLQKDSSHTTATDVQNCSWNQLQKSAALFLFV